MKKRTLFESIMRGLNRKGGLSTPLGRAFSTVATSLYRGIRHTEIERRRNERHITRELRHMKAEQKRLDREARIKYQLETIKNVTPYLQKLYAIQNVPEEDRTKMLRKDLYSIVGGGTHVLKPVEDVINDIEVDYVEAVVADISKPVDIDISEIAPRTDFIIRYTDLPPMVRNSRAWGHMSGNALYTIFYSRGWDSSVSIQEILDTEDIDALDSEGHSIKELLKSYLVPIGADIFTDEDSSYYVGKY